MSFSQQLASLRKARGISQENLADMLGVSRQAVSKWETGETQPEMANLLALCQILKVTPNQLMGYEEMFCAENRSEDTKDKYKKHKRYAVIIVIIIAAAALAAGFFAGRGLQMSPEPASPLEGKESLEITSFIYKFNPVEGRGELKLTFVPSVADESLDYTVMRIDSSGKTETYPAVYNDGVCTVYVETVNWDEVTYIVHVSDGNRFLTREVFRVMDYDNGRYDHEELWKEQ